MNKVSKEQIEAEISSVSYTYDEGTTMCVITLFTGWKVVGVSQCANMEWYDRKMGEEYSHVEAMNKLIEQFTFLEHRAAYFSKYLANQEESKPE